MLLEFPGPRYPTDPNEDEKFSKSMSNGPKLLKEQEMELEFLWKILESHLAGESEPIIVN